MATTSSNIDLAQIDGPWRCCMTLLACYLAVLFFQWYAEKQERELRNEFAMATIDEIIRRLSGPER